MNLDALGTTSQQLDALKMTLNEPKFCLSGSQHIRDRILFLEINLVAVSKSAGSAQDLRGDRH